MLVLAPLALAQDAPLVRVVDARREISVHEIGNLAIAEGPVDIEWIEAGLDAAGDAWIRLKVTDVEARLHDAQWAPGGEIVSWNVDWGPVHAQVLRTPERARAVGCVMVTSSCTFSAEAVRATVDESADVVTYAFPGSAARLQGGARVAGIEPFARAIAYPCNAEGDCVLLSTSKYEDRAPASVAAEYAEGECYIEVYPECVWCAKEGSFCWAEAGKRDLLPGRPDVRPPVLLGPW